MARQSALDPWGLREACLGEFVDPLQGGGPRLWIQASFDKRSSQPIPALLEHGDVVVRNIGIRSFGDVVEATFHNRHQLWCRVDIEPTRLDTGERDRGDLVRGQRAIRQVPAGNGLSGQLSFGWPTLVRKARRTVAERLIDIGVHVGGA